MGFDSQGWPVWEVYAQNDDGSYWFMGALKGRTHEEAWKFAFQKWGVDLPALLTPYRYEEAVNA